jgi:hypothetical protein
MVMSANLRHDQADNQATLEPTMFPAAADGPTTAPETPAPVRELPLAAREAALDAVERALAATVRLQRTLPLPPAPQLNESEEWPRRGTSFEGDVRRLRSRAPLEPVAMAVPPVEEERASAGVLVAKVISAIALASVAGLFAVGVLPLPFSVNSTASPQRASVDAPAPQPRPQVAEPTIPATSPTAEVAAARSPEQAALVERFVALRQQAEQPQPSEPIVPQSVKAVRVVMPTTSQVRALDREEIAGLYDRSQALVEQGDIASARLMLTRAAEAGDARSALALGTTYDPAVLKKLGVIGVAPDPAQAQVWYNKAVELGSPDAALRLEKLAGR